MEVTPRPPRRHDRDSRWEPRSAGLACRPRCPGQLAGRRRAGARAAVAQSPVPKPTGRPAAECRWQDPRIQATWCGACRHCIPHACSTGKLKYRCQRRLQSLGSLHKHSRAPLRDRSGVKSALFVLSSRMPRPHVTATCDVFRAAEATDQSKPWSDDRSRSRDDNDRPYPQRLPISSPTVERAELTAASLLGRLQERPQPRVGLNLGEECREALR